MNGQRASQDGWRKSSYSGANGDCIEIRPGTQTISVRDSKNPDGTILTVSRSMWLEFARHAKTGCITPDA